jgi:hypothetical protein
MKTYRSNAIIAGVLYIIGTVLAVWLIVKGFSPAAIASVPARQL